jgi:hypothetical protein
LLTAVSENDKENSITFTKCWKTFLDFYIFGKDIVGVYSLRYLLLATQLLSNTETTIT